MENVLVFCGEHSDLPVSQYAVKARLSLMMTLSGGAAMSTESISARGLELADAQLATSMWNRDVDREAWGFNFILMDAAAMSAYASYRSTILLTDDPFASASQWAQMMQVELDDLRIRLHRALMNASKIVVLDRDVERAVAPMLSQPVRWSAFPAMPLRVSNSKAHVLMVVHERQGELAEAARNALMQAFPDVNLIVANDARVFDRAWYAVAHVGRATSSIPGLRLRDAWAGALPTLQLVDGENPQFVRTGDKAAELTIDHGKTGLFSSTVEGLVAAFGDLLADPVAARVIARAAQQRVDVAKEWESLAGELLQ